MPAPFLFRRARHAGSIPPMNNTFGQMPLEIGTGSYRGRVSLGYEERRRHLYVVGQTGTGKSTLLLNLIAQDLITGEGVALLDPHGDLAEEVLRNIPRWRSNDLVYVNPADLDRPIGFNPLSGVADHLKPVVADGVVASFRHVWPESWGPRLDYILTHAIRALLDFPGGTLLMLPRLLVDTSFRARMVERHVRDPVVRAFWLSEYDGWSDRFRTEAIAPIQNKIGKALMAPALRNMLAQPKATITPRRLMDEGAMVVCNLSKGALGEATAHLIGALLVAAFAQAALSRTDIPSAQRTPFHLYVDEFQSFATDSFALILSEARKFGLTMTLGHQYLGQLPEPLRAALFGNVGSIIAARAGATDAPILAEEIGLENPGALLDLPNFAGWARLLRNGVPTSPIRLDFYRAPLPCRADICRLAELSRSRFGRPRHEVEAKITRFLGA